MSRMHGNPGLHQGKKTRLETAVSAHQAPYLPFYEGTPLFSLMVAGFVSFLIMVVSPYPLVPILEQLESIDQQIGPGYLLPPGFSFSILLESLLTSLVLMVISMVLVMIEHRRPFAAGFPYILSFPIAWLLIVPSKLEYGGSWIAWVVFGALTAGLFCIHWRTFTWARTIWD